MMISRRLMLLYVTLFSSLMSICVSSQEALLPKNADMVLNNVTVVDVISGSIIAGQAIVIANKRIVEIRHQFQRKIDSKSVKWIDGNAGFVIPGLWDMHVHIAQPSRMEQAVLFLAHGVTGVREMISECRRCGTSTMTIEQLLEKKIAFEHNTLLGPRLLQFSNFANHFGLVSNERVIERFVKESKKKKFDFIKIYSAMSNRDFRWIAKHAHSEKLPIAGHVPNSVTLIEGVLSGMRSIEHTKSLLLYCGRNSNEAIRVTMNNLMHAAKQFDEKTCKDVLKIMQTHDTYYVPTHLTSKMPTLAIQYLAKPSKYLQFIEPLMRWKWQQDAEQYAKKTQREDALTLYRHGLMLTKLAHEQGVQIMLGTDAYDSYIVPGISVHQELQELVNAGLSPLSALQAATINSAKYLNLSNDFGSVAVGKVADLVILQSNPLLDIKQTEHIDGVIYNGRYFDKANIQEMLQSALPKNTSTK